MKIPHTRIRNTSFLYAHITLLHPLSIEPPTYLFLLPHVIPSNLIKVNEIQSERCFGLAFAFLLGFLPKSLKTTIC